MNEPRFSKAHQWLRMESDGTATVGITDYAQQQLGDVVYVELPEVGREVKKDQQVAVVESVKSASDVLTPLSGKIVLVNNTIIDEPAVVNNDPTGSGWFFRLQPANPGEMNDLMDEAAYQKFVSSL